MAFCKVHTLTLSGYRRLCTSFSFGSHPYVAAQKSLHTTREMLCGERWQNVICLQEKKKKKKKVYPIPSILCERLIFLFLLKYIKDIA